MKAVHARLCRSRFAPACLAALAGAACLGVPSDPLAVECEGDDPAVFYAFPERRDEPVEVLGPAEGSLPIELHVRDSGHVSTLGPGLSVERETLITSERGAVIEELVRDIDRARALTVEVWVYQVAREYDHTSPARIVAMSEGTSRDEQNFILGQEEGSDDWDRISLRVRGESIKTDPGDFITNQPLHLAGVIEPGASRLYVGGDMEAESESIDAEFAEWEEFPLNLANEYTSGDGSLRAWLGEYYRVALYPRAMPDQEIRCRAENLPSAYDRR